MAYLVYRMVYVSLELSQPKLLACNLLPHVYIYWGVSFRCTLFLIFFGLCSHLFAENIDPVSFRIADSYTYIVLRTHCPY